MTKRLALYTTVYPQAIRFLESWCESVRKQTDRDFDIWIGADQVERHRTLDALGEGWSLYYREASVGSTPVEVRQAVIREILETRRYWAIVFVDCDDLLHPTRIAAAREQLSGCDLVGCAMDLIDEDALPTGITFDRPAGFQIPESLARHNIFGLSNSAYRTELLSRLLPIPKACLLVDWFMVTMAWGLGARFAFDAAPRMYYRQYGANTARVLPPFTEGDVDAATRLVLDHYKLMLTVKFAMNENVRCALQEAQQDVLAFYRNVVRSPGRLHVYVEQLNRLQQTHVWWDCVAHPALEGA